MPGTSLPLRRELQRGELLGRYEIVGRIGSGGFGRVYRDWDPQIRRPVALKTCETGSNSIRRRFAREARLAGGLDHPNIVRIFDFQEENGLPFMVQEFLAGEDLERRLDSLILRCLEKDAARRPASAEDFIAELEAARGH